MEQSSTVSIIIPVYNVAPYIGQCLESVCAQTYEDLDIIAIDDGSTDGSGAVCDQYAQQDSRIRVFHQDNHGLSHARNVGIDKSQGTILPLTLNFVLFFPLIHSFWRGPARTIEHLDVTREIRQIS